ncbi:MAG: efflux RND transporter permease subunit [Myxococcota bacterium]
MSRGLARFSVRQPVLVNLVGLIMVAVGAFVMQDMTRESIPTVPTGWCRVQIIFPGASAQEIEQQVLTPVENAVWTVDGIREMWGSAREGVGMVFVQFEPEIEDVGRKTLEVQAEVASVDDLPEGAERPEVRTFSVNIPTIAVSVRGEVPERVLRRVGMDLSDALEKIEGVGGVGRNGMRDRRILVDVDPDRLVARGLPLTAVADALRIRGANVPAGTLGGRDARLVRGMARVGSADAVEDVVVRPDPGGGSIRVGDVAEVSEGFGPARVTGRVNGEPGVLLLVRKEPAADSLKISAEVRSLIDGLELPDGVTVDIFGDAAHEVRRSLDSLYLNAATGLILVLALLWFFVGGRNAAMAALGLPVALAGAIAAMHMMGITINVISLLALILCLGIVVDDAIIIIENIYRHMEEGVPRRQAAIRGAAEVFWPVISSTATTCAAFLPMLLMSGVLGKFFAMIPKVVVASLLASLIEAFFILPSHMADFGRLQRNAERPKTRWERIGERVGVVYERWLRGALRRRYWVIGGAYVLAIGLVAAAALTKDVVLFNEGDVDMFDVRITLASDASKEVTDEVLAEVEQRLLALENPDVEAIVAARGVTRTDMGVDRGDHVAMVTVYLKPPAERSSIRAGTALLDDARGLFDDLVGPSSLQVIEFRPGPPRGAPVALRIFGDDLEELADLAGQASAELRQVPGVRNVASDYQLGKRELRVVVDESRAALHGVTPPLVAGWLQSAFGATPVATTREGDDEIDIVVQLNEEARSDPRRLAALSLMAPTGPVELREIADIEHGRGPAIIKHKDRDRVVKVTAQIDEGTTSAAVNRALRDRIDELVRANPDVRFELGGEYESTNESLESLRNAFGVAILVIFTILATQFRSFVQPLVVMAAIPLSFIGVVVGFFVSGAPVGLIALIGVVGLAGIVVNDSLVLVDFINQRRGPDVDVDDAIAEASLLRLRPIFLTSITTVAGLFPLALAGAESPLLSPMATAIAWGLSFATVLTLILVPCLYRAAYDLSSGGARALGPLTRWLTDPGDAAVDQTPAE